MCKQIAFSIVPGGPTGKDPKVMRCSFNPRSGRPLEKKMANCSSILTWKIPWTFFFLVGYSLWGCKEAGTTELTHTQIEFENKSPYKLMTDIYTDIILIRIQV